MKSHVSDLLVLATHIYQDAVAKCVADISDLRDLKTIKSRTKKEGLSFLTITLPSFATDFERSIAIGYIDPKFFRSFRKNGPIPALLQGMVGLLFDRETGRILSNDPHELQKQAEVVKAIRQICLFAKKIRLACTPNRVLRALEGFAQVERYLAESKVQPEDEAAFKAVSRWCWGDVVRAIDSSSLVPHHGPGNTADRLISNEKYRLQLYYERLEPYFPFLGNVLSVDSYINRDTGEFDSVTLIPPDMELPVKVTPVPKTLKGPRIIAIEPTCMQFVQQGIRAALYSAIESSRLTGGHVNFTDQSVNQVHALDGSRTGLLATIDLSDASDRVPRDLALSMFDSNPVLQEMIDACRSTHAKLPDGRVIGPLNKFASMGSALCFPIESMYFYAVCIVGLLRAQNLPETRRNVLNVSRDVYVYGDDIIVPSAYATTVMDTLQKYLCKVNINKTYWHGFFRESCGVDAFAGKQVTVTYVRELPPINRRSVASLISWVETANQFLEAGYRSTAEHMFLTCERRIGSLPFLPRDSGALSRNSQVIDSIDIFVHPSFGVYLDNWNVNLQRLEVKAWVASPIDRTDRLENYAALQKCLLSMERRSKSRSSLSSAYIQNKDEARSRRESVRPIPVDPKHLERTALFGTATLKRRGVPRL